MITFTCPGCRHQLLVDQTLVGRSCRCPHCRLVVQLRRTTRLSRTSGVEADSHECATADPDAAEQAAVTAQALSVPGYELGEELGRGGMGVVYRARHLKLDRVVALKMILAADQASAAQRQRFLKEADAIARLRHPGIIAVHEVAEHQGRPYFALEYVEGGSLERYLGGRPLRMRDAAALALQMARAVDHAHQKGIVHRDLKPANVLVDGATRPVPSGLADLEAPPPVTLKIADFGLAKVLDSTDGATRTGSVLGTPSYMAPEQAGGRTREVGPAADVYSLGAVLYEMLTGQPPFRAANPLDTLLLVLETEPVPPSRLQPRMSRDLETVCLKCLHKEPARRYASAAELADDLERFLAGRPVRARPLSAPGRLVRWARRRPSSAALGAACLLLLLGLIVGGAAYGWHENVQRRGLEGLEQTANQARLDAGDAREKYRRLAERDARMKKEAIREAARLEKELLQSRIDVPREMARQMIERAQGLCEEKRTVRVGLLWFARGLVVAPPGSEEERLARLNLARWWPRLEVSCRLVLDHAYVQAAAFSPDGRFVVTGSSRAVGSSKTRYTAQVREVATGKRLAVLPHTHPVASVAWSPDGKMIATGSGPAKRYEWGKAGAGEARVWEARTGKPLGPPLRHGGTVRAVAFRPPDGKVLLTACHDRQARLWSVPGGVLQRALRHDGAVSGAAFYPDGKTFVTSTVWVNAKDWRGSLLRWWNADGTPRQEQVRHNHGIEIMALSRDGKLLAASGGPAQVWQTELGAAKFGQKFGPLMGQGRWGLALSDDGQLVASGGNNWTVHLWRSGTASLIGQGLLMNGWVYSMAISPDNRQFLVGDGGWASLWNVLPQRPTPARLQVKQGVHHLAFGPDLGRVAAMLDGNRVQVFDTGTGQPVGKPLPHRSGTPGLALARDGQTVVTTCYDRQVRVWNALEGKLLWPAWAHPAEVDVVALDGADRRVVTGCRDGKARVFDLGTGKQLAELSHDGQAVTAVAISGDGHFVVTGTRDFQVRKWDVATGKVLGKVVRMGGQPESLALTRDARRVLVGTRGDEAARLMDLDTGEPAGPLLRHKGPVRAVAISPDEKLLLTSGERDGTSRVWDAATGLPVGPAIRQGGHVRAVAFSADGRTTWSAATDRSLQAEALPAPLAGDPRRIYWTVLLRSMMYLDGEVEGTLHGPSWHSVRQTLDKLGGPIAP
jgi:serine/threonine protein kinase/WD40 repeat protein